MSTTVGTLEKKVESVMENLTPEELAKLINKEVISISYTQATGKDQDARLAEIHRIYNKYVLTKDWPGYAKFWRTMDEEDIRYWSRTYFTSMLQGLERESALITLLLLSESRIWLVDYIAWTKNHNPEQKEILEDKRKRIKEFLQRWQEIQQAGKEALDAGFWEQWQMPRPTIHITTEEEFRDLFGDLEEWIMARDLS